MNATQLAARTAQHRQEIEQGGRFAFGENWRRFLEVMNEDRVAVATQTLQAMLGRQRLDGLSFLDIGSGSGLSSLAARRLGAQVVSFDYDSESVACTAELRRRFSIDDDAGWKVMQGSVLDDVFLRTLGQFDIVYSWGVLHHTGAMWKAMEAAAARVKTGGRFFVAIYNDQGMWSKRWYKIKKMYCSGLAGRAALSATVIPYWHLTHILRDLIRLRSPLERYREYKQRRGMSISHDYIDWLGGYPFEVAKPEEIFEFCKTRGFELEKLVTVRGTEGCNEFVFRRIR